MSRVLKVPRKRFLRLTGPKAGGFLSLTGLSGRGLWWRLRRKFYNAACRRQNRKTAPAASVGRFIRKSFYVQARDQLRPTWRPSAESPHEKCNPFGADAPPFPRRGNFSCRLTLGLISTTKYHAAKISPSGGDVAAGDRRGAFPSGASPVVKVFTAIGSASLETSPLCGRNPSFGAKHTNDRTRAPKAPEPSCCRE